MWLAGAGVVVFTHPHFRHERWKGRAGVESSSHTAVQSGDRCHWLGDACSPQYTWDQSSFCMFYFAIASACCLPCGWHTTSLFCNYDGMHISIGHLEPKSHARTAARLDAMPVVPESWQPHQYDIPCRGQKFYTFCRLRRSARRPKFVAGNEWWN